MNTTDGTEVGTVVLAACDSGALVITFTAASDTTAAGDIITDEWKLAEAGDYTKTYESGYPSVNESTKVVTIRSRVPTTHANGYNISEHGTFNTDGTILMGTRSTITSFSKSSTDELIFMERIYFENES